MKMQKSIQKWVWPATLLCLSTQTIMAQESIGCSPFGGFYTGGAVGGLFTSARESRTTDLTVSFVEDVPRLPRSLQAPASYTLQNAQRKNTIAVNLYTGYGCAWEDVYMGLEAFINRTDYKRRSRASLSATEINSATGTNRLDASFSDTLLLSTRLAPSELGIDVRPGFFLTPCTLLYGRLGVAYNKLTLHADTNPSVMVTVPLTTGTPIVGRDFASKHKKVGALRLGIGLEQSLCENFSIRADYINTHYRGIKIRTPGNTDIPILDLNGGITQLSTHTTAQISSFFNNAVTLGMSYYW